MSGSWVLKYSIFLRWLLAWMGKKINPFVSSLYPPSLPWSSQTHITDFFVNCNWIWLVFLSATLSTTTGYVNPLAENLSLFLWCLHEIFWCPTQSFNCCLSSQSQFYFFHFLRRLRDGNSRIRKVDQKTLKLNVKLSKIGIMP